MGKGYRPTVEKMDDDITKLCADMEKFCGLYTEDPAVWQGEAAKEETCYITADIDDFRALAEDMRKEMRKLAGGR